MSQPQELKALLDERGVECKGCAEKDDLVKRVKETYHLPLQEKPKESPKAPEKSTEDKVKDKELDEMIKKLQRDMKMGGNGGPGFNVFRAEDLKDLTPEQMQEKFGRGNTEL